MKVKSESEVSQSCPTLSDPMDCSLPGSSVHGIFQARVLEWGAIAFSGKGHRGFEFLPAPSLSPKGDPQAVLRPHELWGGPAARNKTSTADSCGGTSFSL